MTGPAVPPGGEGHTHPGDGRVGGVLVPEFGCPACDLAMRSAAIPPGGEELREAMADSLCEAMRRTAPHLADCLSTAGWMCLSDAALSTVREALAAQETVRRVEELAARFPSDVSVINAGRVRRALAGDPT